MEPHPPLPSDFCLEGRLVVLRPVSPDHAPALFPLVHGRAEVLRWLIWEGPESSEDLAASFAQWRNPSPWGEGAHLVILERERDRERPVGTIGLRFQSPGVGDIGYWLGSEVWGRGLATEAVALLARCVLLELGATALCAWVDVGNTASRRVLEKNGFTLEETVAGMAKKKSGPVDQWGFVLTAEELRARE